MCSRRLVNVRVCTATHALKIKKGRSSCLVTRAQATLVGCRHACTSVCNGSKIKVLTVTKETGPVGGWGVNGLLWCVAGQPSAVTKLGLVTCW